MAKYDYDLFVIGAGSGGVRASRIAAGFGAKVAVAEHYRVGGTCVIRGCVPKKLMVYASHFREDFEDAAGYGWTVGESRFSWPEFIARKDAEIARLEGIYGKLLQGSGVEVHRARATLQDAHTVKVGDRAVTAAHILIATGGWPQMPELRGVEHCISSNEVFELREMPKRILIVGGGYIAVEFAGIFNGLGSKVGLSYRGEHLLRGFDQEVREHLGVEMVAKGVRVMLDSHVTGVAKQADGSLAASVRVENMDTALECDAVLMATGRSPTTKGLGLEAAGVALDDHGAVKVDRHCRSNVPHIYAVGDVTNRIQLTPVAIREGQAVATTLFGKGSPVAIDHASVPSAVFSQPQVAVVGATEQEAAEAHDEVHVYKAVFRALKHTLSGRQEKTLMKLVVDGASQRVLGAHMVGPDAGEIIQGIGIAVKAGLTKADFDATVGIHPTAAEEFVTLKEKRVVKGKRAAAGA